MKKRLQKLKLIIIIMLSVLSAASTFAEEKSINIYNNAGEMSEDYKLKDGNLVFIEGRNTVDDGLASFGLITNKKGQDSWRYIPLKNGLFFKNINLGLNNSTIIKSSMDSFIAFKNTAYASDNATRVYIEPSSKTTKSSNTINDSGNILSGVGGALKIFGDAYTEGANYRDLGIYFHANQNGDLGYNKTGNFFINSKVSGARYTLGNKTLSPDIVFSFQDGKTIGGRFIHTDKTSNSLNTYSFATLYLGSNSVPSANNSYALKQFESADVNAKNNIALEIAGGAGMATPNLIFTNSKAEKIGEYIIDETNALNKNIMSTNIRKESDKYIVQKVKEWNSSSQEVGAVSSFEVTANLAVLNGGKEHIIDKIIGEDDKGVGNGFELILLFKNGGNTTISNKGNIKIKEAITPKDYSTLTLIKWDGVWVEKSRALN